MYRFSEKAFILITVTSSTKLSGEFINSGIFTHQLKRLCRLGIHLALSNLIEVASITEFLVKFTMLSLLWPIVTLNLALNKIQCTDPF